MYAQTCVWFVQAPGTLIWSTLISRLTCAGEDTKYTVAEKTSTT